MEGDVLNAVAKLSLYFTVGGGILPHHNHMTPLPFGVKESLFELGDTATRSRSQKQIFPCLSGRPEQSDQHYFIQ